jgi:hypothetical protein
MAFFTVEAPLNFLPRAAAQDLDQNHQVREATLVEAVVLLRNARDEVPLPQQQLQ